MFSSVSQLILELMANLIEPNIKMHLQKLTVYLKVKTWLWLKHLYIFKNVKILFLWQSKLHLLLKLENQRNTKVTRDEGFKILVKKKKKLKGKNVTSSRIFSFQEEMKRLNRQLFYLLFQSPGLLLGKFRTPALLVRG